MKYIKEKKKVFIVGGIIIILIGGALLFRYKAVFVAAMVDGHPISRLSVLRQTEKERGKTVLESLIVEALINKEAQKKGVTVTKDEIDAEIKDVEQAISAQGSSLDDALHAQGMTKDDLVHQVTIQKKIEKILGDKVQVTPEEVEKYITDSKLVLPPGKEDIAKKQIAKTIQQQKLAGVAPGWINDLRANAKIRYFVQY